MNRISPTLLKTDFKVFTRVITRDGFSEVEGGSGKCYFEKKKKRVNNQNGFDIVLDVLIVYDDEDLIVKAGDRVECRGESFTITSDDRYFPNDVYHHTELRGE